MPESKESKEEAKKRLKEWEAKLNGVEEKQEIELTPVTKAALVLLAQGISPAVVATTLSMEEDELVDLAGQPASLDFLIRIQSALNLSPEELIKRNVNIAIAVKQRLMLGGSERQQAEASSFFIEQGIGKATQRIETKNLTLVGTASLETIDRQIAEAAERVNKLSQHLQASGLLQAKSA